MYYIIQCLGLRRIFMLGSAKPPPNLQFAKFVAFYLTVTPIHLSLLLASDKVLLSLIHIDGRDVINHVSTINFHVSPINLKG
ncbi:hypothetical protein NIES4071_37470 [Calothrix sp. NIES-4071]|nr:hypothetical protein NIES4071_37470 [Calothrix sp. NIES-4071]BAZ58064.1 hypothetical protein NIES4105_37400 [Calothrix sp. NIES-4105]